MTQQDLKKKQILQSVLLICLCTTINISLKADGAIPRNGILSTSSIHFFYPVDDTLKVPTVGKKDFGFSGGASVFASTYNSNIQNISSSPFNYGISLATSLKFKKNSFPFSLSYSNNMLNVSYPYFRIGCAPSYKWMKLYLGNQTLSYNRYVFSGINVFGVGFEIHPGWFYLSAISGNLAKKNFVDSLSTSYNNVRPRFSANGFAIKSGVKTRSFQLLFTYFSGNEDKTSIRYSNPKYFLTPRMGKALGAEMGIRFSKYVNFSSIGGLSIFTRNKDAGNLDTLLKASQAQPLPAWAKIIEGKPNTTTQIFYAFENSLRYENKIFSLGIKQKRIMPEFKNLGLRIEGNDIDQYTIEPGFTFWDGKLTSNITVGIQNNNLLSKSALSTNSKIYEVSVNYAANENFFLNASFSNFGIQTSSTSIASEDSISIRNVSSNIGLSSNYVLEQNADINRSLSFNLNNQRTTEIYENSKFNNSDFNSFFANLAYSVSKPHGLNYNVGLNYSKSGTLLAEFNNKILDVQMYGMFGGVSMNIFQNKTKDRSLTIGAGTNLNYSGLAGGKKSLATGLGLNLIFAFAKNMTFTAGYTHSSNTIEHVRLLQNSFNTNIQTNF
mgnify:CR=1 FL=1